MHWTYRILKKTKKLESTDRHSERELVMIHFICFKIRNTNASPRQNMTFIDLNLTVGRLHNNYDLCERSRCKRPRAQKKEKRKADDAVS